MACAFRAPAATDLDGMTCAFLAAYRSANRDADHAILEARLTVLLPMLLLARVDGKSPAEYLGETHKGILRAFAPRFIRTSADSLSEFTAAWIAAISD